MHCRLIDAITQLKTLIVYQLTQVISSHFWSTRVLVLFSGISYYSGTKGYDRVANRYRLVTILQTDLCIYSEIHIHTLQYRASDKSYACYPCPCQV